MPRDTIFICHATPDDNDFVRWIGARLTGYGYKVWADLFELPGGTPAWTSIEEAIRNNAIKVLFVASNNSVSLDRGGVRNELSVADAVKRELKDASYIIPLKIDDVPFAQLPIQIHQLIAIDFSSGWGGMLNTLLEALEKAKVPHHPESRTEDFERWRQTSVRVSTLVETASEPVLTNLTAINKLPATISFFSYEGSKPALDSALKGAGIPVVSFFQLYIAFAEMSALQAALPPSIALQVRAHVAFPDFIEGKVEDVTSPSRADARNMATGLLRKHIERYLLQRGLKAYEASSGSAFYFPSGLVTNNKVSYTAASGRKTNKNVVGRSERLGVNWHLAMKVNVTLGPPAMVRFKPYICFSEDGQKAITDPKRTSAIRRRFCKNWWNLQWRQLQEAFAVFLANDQDEFVIQLDGSQELALSGSLLQLMAARRIPDDLKVVEDEEDPTEPEDDDDEDHQEVVDEPVSTERDDPL